MELAKQLDNSTFRPGPHDKAPNKIMGTCNSPPHIVVASGGLIKLPAHNYLDRETPRILSVSAVSLAK